MTRFRIAHASDLHLGRKANWINPVEMALSRDAHGALWAVLDAGGRGLRSKITYPSTFNPDAANRLLDNINRLAPSIDMLVLTGDLATTGIRDDLEIARNYLDGHPSSLWDPKPKQSVLANPKMKVIALPGNHDRYAAKFHEPTSVEFENFFGRLWDTGKGHSREPVGSPLERVRYSTVQDNNNILLIVAADFTLRDRKQGTRPLGYLGQGAVTESLVSEMIQVTSTYRNHPKLNVFVVWAIHFAPNHPINRKSLELLNSQYLVDEATDAGVDLLICGHTHVQGRYSLTSSKGKTLEVVCSGPSCGVGPEHTHGFSLIDVDFAESGTSFQLESKKWCWDQQDFV